MTDPHITPELRVLIDRHLGTLDEIEALVVLFARRGSALSPAQVAEAARKGEESVRPHLENLAARGFLLHHTENGTFSYPDRGSAVDEPVAQLARMYEERPVTLIRALYERPSNAVRSFADAFRMRRG